MDIVFKPGSEGLMDITVTAVLVKVGDWVEAGQALATVSAEKSSWEVTTDFDGQVESVRVKPGDNIAPGETVLTLTSSAGWDLLQPASPPASAAPDDRSPAPPDRQGGPADEHRLTLHNQPLGDAGTVRLTASGWPTRLHRLALCRCNISSSGVRALAAATWPHLHALHLDGNPLSGDDGAGALASARGFGALRELRLDECEIGPAGARELAGSTTLTELTDLRLRDNPIGGSGVAAFGSARLPRLANLELAADLVSPPELAALLTAPGLPSLSRLVLNGRVLEGDRLQRARCRVALSVPGCNDEERALLAAVRAEPDDDTVRLVYADWVEEQGEAERALFIRTQIEAERLPLDDPRRASLLESAAELHRVHASAWIEPTLDLLGGDGYFPVYRRGFPEELTAREVRLLSWWLTVYPIRTLRFEPEGRDEGVPALVRVSGLAHLRTLTLSSTWVDTMRGVFQIPLATEHAALLAGCAELQGLEQFALVGQYGGHDDISPEAVRRLEEAFGARLEVR